ncbi:MAG TPA: hypothetical protein VII79_06355, partial [Candidatus Dormibacteraeota bacterium]
SATIWPHYLVYVFPLALATLAASQLRVRATGMVSLLFLDWVGRSDGLWGGLIVLWVAAGLLVVGTLRGRVAPARTIGAAGLRPSA